MAIAANSAEVVLHQCLIAATFDP